MSLTGLEPFRWYYRDEIDLELTFNGAHQEMEESSLALLVETTVAHELTRWPRFDSRSNFQNRMELTNSVMLIQL